MFQVLFNQEQLSNTYMYIHVHTCTSHMYLYVGKIHKLWNFIVSFSCYGYRKLSIVERGTAFKVLNESAHLQSILYLKTL